MHELGDGVVGDQPKIHPGRYHRYSSFSVIETPVGTMEGSYQMVTESGDHFDTAIPRFSLSDPSALH